MKKVLLVLAVAILSLSGMNAQTAFKKGTNVAGLNVGFGGGWGIPITVSYERGVYNINKDMSIGVGGLIGYSGTSNAYTYGKWSYTNIIIGARGGFHYTGVKKLDLYAGLTLGYDIVSGSYKWNAGYEMPTTPESSSASSLIWTGHIGARYFFTKAFGINLELGYGLSLANIGVAYKF